MRQLPFPRCCFVFIISLVAAGFVCSSAAADNSAPTAQQISDKVEDEFLFDAAVNSARIDVATKDGIVHLRGQVDNMLARQRAARIAETVKGVRAVVNEITVKPPVLRSDVDIQSDIEIALVQDPAADSYEVQTSVEHGVVTLRGKVDSYREAELTRKIAMGVRGVIDLQDQLKIDYRTDRADAEILGEIISSLRWHRYIDDNLIHVEVKNGEVVLSGVVGSAAERNLAASTAWVAGVRSVDTSQLMVEGWARDEQLRGDKYVDKAGAALREAVQDALSLDPRVNAFDVRVDVNLTTVTLRGTVDNLKAKRAAEQDAQNTVGVTNVVNRLKVKPTESLDNTEIANRLRDAFDRDVYLDRFDISVNVINGTAYLYGAVDSRFEKNWADDVASRVRGVVDVQNHLSVSRNDAGRQ